MHEMHGLNGGCNWADVFPNSMAARWIHGVGKMSRSIGCNVVSWGIRGI